MGGRGPRRRSKRLKRSRIGLWALVLTGTVVVGATSPRAAAHPLGMYIYRDTNDKLVMIFPWSIYWPIKYRVPPFAGFVDGDYPFEEALGDRPFSGLFRPHLECKIELVVVEFDPGLYVRDPQDIHTPFRHPGQNMTIGTTGTAFLSFPWWHLDDSDPAFNPNQESWAASFYLRDISGVHGDSDVYTFNVYPNEGYCPADLTLTAIPGTPGYGVPDGMLTTDDFFYYLQQYAASNWLVADLTSTAVPGAPGYGIPDGIINSDDFFYYLALYDLGC